MAAALSPAHNAMMKEISRRAISLQNPARDLALLIERIAGAKVVMLGEASHGTHEFYEWRRVISQILISKHGFNTLAIEGDWPPCQEMNRFLTGNSSAGERSAEQLLARSFRRWPTWMWANREFAAMVEWMKAFNQQQRDENSHEKQVRLYGLDVYSLFDSISVVLDEVEKIDPELSERARRHYACFDPFRSDEEEYLQSLVDFPEGCRAQAVRVLKELLTKREQLVNDGDVVFDAQQNARIVKNAEGYYRAMVLGNEDSWNVRERHMMETLNLVLDKRPENKMIVWAHNTHIGDYRATNMGKMEQVNIGGLAREKYGEKQVALVGFGTFHGSVIASSKWSGPIMELPVPEGRDGSYERVMHEATVKELPGDAFYMILDDPAAKNLLSDWRGHRAIGVVYDPRKEKWGNYVPTMLARRYDAFIYIHRTRALEPLKVKAEARELPETFPSGQ